MQCVILAAGKGTRMHPLTNDRPKPMVELLGKPLLEHILEQLPKQVKEFIIVTGYRGEQIRDYFGDSWSGNKITYVKQEEQCGPAHALFITKNYIHGKFFLVYSDDIHDTLSLEKGLAHNYCLFVKEHDHPEQFGVVGVNETGYLDYIIEKPERPQSNLVSTGAMVLSPGIFSTTLVKHPVKNECFIPDLLMQIVEREPIHVIKQKTWLTVTIPEDIQLIENKLQGA